MRIIAHLSDLHFGTEIPVLVKGLTKYLSELRPHVVAVSGDLTQRARRSQFIRARAFLDTLPGALVVVPGNHDVPLYNVFARFGDPLGGFRRHITREAHPSFEDAEVAVVGANTTRSFTIKDGGLRHADVRRLSAFFEGTAPESVRIVVCHHPFDPLAGHGGRWTAPKPDREAVNTLVDCGADVFLTGHLHLTYVGHTALRYQVQGRSAIVVEAGTATSARSRGEENAFNVLRLERDRIVVEHLAWAADAFRTASREEFQRTESGWLPVASSSRQPVKPSIRPFVS